MVVMLAIAIPFTFYVGKAFGIIEERGRSQDNDAG